ncbi:MAG: chromate transporter [Christensenellaceae bacterium]|nr:chromate transporter [Clostridiales bacterium]
MPLLLDLFCAFFRIGLFTFGGGYAMLPLLQREIVEKKHWATEEELLDYFAVGQCTPGIIAVNTATFVGFKEKKLSGAIFATLGVVSPSLVIITVIAALLSNFAHIAAVQNAFAGIRVAVCVLILNSIVKLWKKSVVDKLTLGVFIAVFLGSVLLSHVSPVVFIVAAAVLGIVVRVWLRTGKEGKA